MEAGGTIVCLNRSNEYAVKDLWAGAKLPLEGLNNKEFYCPGSLLRVLVDNTLPVSYGFSREETIMYLHSLIFELSEGESVAWYPEAAPLISGWVLGEAPEGENRGGRGLVGGRRNHHDRLPAPLQEPEQGNVQAAVQQHLLWLILTFLDCGFLKGLYFQPSIHSMI